MAEEASVIRRQKKAQPEFRGRVMVEATIVWPQVVTPGSPAGGRISAFYSDRAAAYYDWVTHSFYSAAVTEYLGSRKNGFPFRPYAAAQDFSVPLNQNRLLSLYTDTYEFTGGAHGNTVRAAETWSLVTGDRVTQGDIFRGPGYESVIFRSVSSQIAAQIEQGTGVYLDGWQRGIFRYYDRKNFYLTPAGYAVYYPLYTIAPYVSGIVTFVVPWREFGDLLRLPAGASV